MGPMNQAWVFLKDYGTDEPTGRRRMLPLPTMGEFGRGAGHQGGPPDIEDYPGGEDLGPDDYEEDLHDYEKEHGDRPMEDLAEEEEADEKEAAGFPEKPRLLSARPPQGLDLSTPKNPFQKAWDILKNLQGHDYGDIENPDKPNLGRTQFSFTDRPDSMSPANQVEAQRPAHLTDAEEQRLAGLSEAQGSTSANMHFSQMLGQLRGKLDETIPGSLERMRLEGQIEDLQQRVDRMRTGGDTPPPSL